MGYLGRTLNHYLVRIEPAEGGIGGRKTETMPK